MTAPRPRLAPPRRALLAAPLGLLPAAPRPAAASGVTRRAGLLITGQSNAGWFLEDGGIWIMNAGLAALLGLPSARYDPRLHGIGEMDGYALRDGFHDNPPMATTSGGTPLWYPGDEGAFLAHRPGTDPARWPRGHAGAALDRFVRELLTPRDRAACLGILWIHTESDTNDRRMPEAATHAAAIRRHLALTRAAFGRPATGPGALPAYGWAPIPFGRSAEGHRAVRAAIAEVAADPAQGFSLAIAQTADSEPRDGQDWSHRDAPDLRAFSRRAAYAIAADQRRRQGLPPDPRFPSTGPRILRAWAEGSEATGVAIAFDEGGGRRLKASRAAQDGRGWSILDDGARRRVTGLEVTGPDRLRLRHAACTGPEGRRALGYALLGEQVGRGNAVTDDWGERDPQAPPPAGLRRGEWRFDLPLQATLLPVPVSATEAAAAGG